MVARTVAAIVVPITVVCLSHDASVASPQLGVEDMVVLTAWQTGVRTHTQTHATYTYMHTYTLIHA